MKHESSKMGKDEWLTPPEIIQALGVFDLDPCAPIEEQRPFQTAKKYYTENDNGLMHNWEGRVWMNPPYGKHTKHWMNKLAMHGNGIAFIFARTETGTFFPYVWQCAYSVFFFKGRITFYHNTGIKAKEPAPAPSCLIAYGKNNSLLIDQSGLRGKHILINQTD